MTIHDQKNQFQTAQVHLPVGGVHSPVCPGVLRDADVRGLRIPSISYKITTGWNPSSNHFKTMTIHDQKNQFQTAQVHLPVGGVHSPVCPGVLRDADVRGRHRVTTGWNPSLNHFKTMTIHDQKNQFQTAQVHLPVGGVHSPVCPGVLCDADVRGRRRCPAVKTMTIHDQKNQFQTAQVHLPVGGVHSPVCPGVLCDADVRGRRRCPAAGCHRPHQYGTAASQCGGSRRQDV